MIEMSPLCWQLFLIIVKSALETAVHRPTPQPLSPEPSFMDAYLRGGQTFVSWINFCESSGVLRFHVFLICGVGSARHLDPIRPLVLQVMH